MKKIEKKDWIELGLIIITTLLLCSNFLQMHFSSDTYVLYHYGYFEYPTHYFLPDARFISAFACYIGGFLHLPIPVYIISMDFIGMIFLSLSIYIFSKTMIKIIRPNNLTFEVLIIVASHLLILNQFVLEYLLFPESAVMCLGVLFTIIAVKIFAEKPSQTYLKIFLFLVLTALSYQGELNIFPILAIFILIINQINKPQTMKVFSKNFSKELLKMSLLIILIFMLSIFLALFQKNIFSYSQRHYVNFLNKKEIIYQYKTTIRYIKIIWTNCIYMLPKHSFLITIFLSLIILLKMNSKKHIILLYLFLIFVIFLNSFISTFLFDSGISGRTNAALCMIFGFSSLIIINLSYYNENNLNKNIAIAFTIILFSINGLFIIQNLTEHISANRIDENDGMKIRRIVKEYEEKNNIEVTKFICKYDKHPEKYAYGIKPMQSLTERKFACTWSYCYAINYYCNKNLKQIKYNLDNSKYIETYFYNLPTNDYNDFSDVQVCLFDDILCLIVY